MNCELAVTTQLYTCCERKFDQFYLVQIADCDKHFTSI